MADTASTIPPRADDPAYNHEYATVNGIRMHYIDVDPRDGVPVVLVHGWPDLWYGWRHQIQALRATYRVIVPDNRGFGETESPLSPASYGRKTIATDLVHLLDHLDIQHAVFIGHDWGGVVVWRMCQYFPERVLAVASICTPYVPRPKALLPWATFLDHMPNFKYQHVLVAPNAGDAFDKHARAAFRYLFGTPVANDFGSLYENLVHLDKLEFAPGATSPLVDEIDLAYYVEQYTKRGFATSLHWYKQYERDWDESANAPTELRHPVLYIGAGKDIALPPALSAGMERVIPNLTRRVIENGGHWLGIEAPREVNHMLLEWLTHVMPPTSPRL
ncbi:hypothetical protein, variant [Aphanomyces invadans]|uniref:AB hydrolase-1 domain-containing protein n=1 Tax=Aphanomyces invadans TaxID=157072 RepID=A0A024TGI6_9STRA|nr:hypothetical protein, variant [Aphanomyces invadans]ETV93124.1 hypothetical protein, variant [Aphanomyces invadans]|eukprot:XP_008878145.1 hypothetical protein, variant [Aphanomyces invadans]